MPKSVIDLSISKPGIAFLPARKCPGIFYRRGFLRRLTSIGIQSSNSEEQICIISFLLAVRQINTKGRKDSVRIA